MESIAPAIGALERRDGPKAGFEAVCTGKKTARHGARVCINLGHPVCYERWAKYCGKADWWLPPTPRIMRRHMCTCFAVPSMKLFCSSTRTSLYVRFAAMLPARPYEPHDGWWRLTCRNAGTNETAVMPRLKDLTEHEILAARRRGATAVANEPRALEAWYDRQHDLISVRLDSGRLVSVPRANLQELAGARPDLLQEVEILGPGSAIHFPNAGAGFTVASLVREQYGSPDWMAQITRSAGTGTSGKRKPHQPHASRRVGTRHAGSVRH